MRPALSTTTQKTTQRGIGWFVRLANFLATLGTLWIFVLMGLVVVDVDGRNFFGLPLTGLAEFAEFAGLSVVAIVFLQLGTGVHNRRMTRAGFLIDRIARRLPRVRLALDVAYALAGCVIFALLAWVAWAELVESWRSSEFYGVRGLYMIPGWPFRALVVIGAAMASLAFLFLVPALLSDAPDGTRGLSDE